MPSPARIRSTIAAIAAPPEDLREVAVVHKAMADPTRLRILERLARGEGTVTDLMRHVDLSQPLVSASRNANEVSFAIQRGGGEAHYRGTWDGNKLSGAISSKAAGGGDVGTFELYPR